MSTDSTDNTAMEEWQETRKVLKRFDEDQHDLRKYGFIFLASLLTADSVQAYFKLDVFVRCAMLIITIVFIVGLRLLDHHYKNFQNATVIRSRILEANLNIELSEIIGEHYARENWDRYISDLYYAFVAITVLLGIAILTPIESSTNPTTILLSYVCLAIFLVAAGIGSWKIHEFSKSLVVNFERRDFNDFNDWTLDKLSCVQGEKVKISVTNPALKVTTTLPANEVAFKILDEMDISVHIELVKKDITLVNYGTYSWLWDTSDVEPDKIYRVLPRGRSDPLRRSITVYKKMPNEDQKQNHK